jgi:Mn2+/Fe2+ NRAMP family transporter
VEEQVAKGRHRIWQREGASNSELRYRAWDVGIGMFFSQLVAFFIIVGTGATLYVAGHRNIASAAEAAQSLTPLAGPLAEALFAVGIVGTGILAVPVLTASAAYAVAETFDWPSGLNASPTRAPQFYAVIVLATIAAAAFNFLGINPIQALVLASVISGLLTPPLLLVLMLIANNRTIMGERTNGRLLNVLGWGMTAIMSAGALALIVTVVRGG